MSIRLIHAGRFAAAAMGLVALTSLPAEAQFGPFTSGPGGQNPAPPSFVPEVAPGVYEFGSPVNRVEVRYATGAGSFEKVLTVPPDPNQDGVTDAADLAFLASQPLQLNEYFVIGPTRGWTDWHETILSPGWEWGHAFLTAPNAPGGVTGLTTVQAGGQVDFYFDELAVGTEVDIEKEIWFTGDPTSFTPQDFANWAVGEFRVRIAEHPTSVPEPAAATACLAGLAGLLVRRSRI